LSDRAKSIIIAAVIAAILYILISPIPEMDATTHCRVVVVTAFPGAVVAHLSSQSLIEAHRVGQLRTVKDIPELLTVLCVRNC
jgi:hypothetical protein